MVSVNCCRIPIIDVSPGLHGRSVESRQVISAIGEACMGTGVFYVVGHGVPMDTQAQLEEAATRFFAMPSSKKKSIEMARAGQRWRGYFSVGEELTSGVVDQKEGLYFARESPLDTRPLHGANLFPAKGDAPGLRLAVLSYMEALEALSSALLQAIGVSIGLPDDHFRAAFSEPTTLFRIFHYPPHDNRWGQMSMGVGEHTDYGYLTILKQDASGGLQVRTVDGEWAEVPPIPDAFVVNLGDALERSTGGLLRGTPTPTQRPTNAAPPAPRQLARRCEHEFATCHALAGSLLLAQ